MRVVAVRCIAAILIVMLGGASVALRAAWGQTPSTPSSAPGTFLLTIFFRHDQAKTLGEINAHLRQTGCYTKFPPPGIEVVSWYVMMGIGHVVTLRIPAERVREVNRVIEETAWGGYHSELYPTYDSKAIAEEQRKPGP